jgi:hypothetical protein
MVIGSERGNVTEKISNWLLLRFFHASEEIWVIHQSGPQIIADLLEHIIRQDVG